MKPVRPEEPLESSRLILEPQIEAHAARIRDDLLDDRLYEFVPQDPPTTKEAFEALVKRFAWLSRRLSTDGTEAWLNWVVRDCLSGEYVGTVQGTVQADLNCLIAYQTFPRFWRRAYAKESCARVVRHLFEDYSARSVGALIDTRNIASIKLVESLGMTRRETIKDANFFKGASSDESRYAVDRAGWLPS
jgi:RimJ/RimL family protein N-acetyltransferase